MKNVSQTNIVKPKEFTFSSTSIFSSSYLSQKTHWYSSFLARPEVTDYQQDSYSEVLGGKVILALGTKNHKCINPVKWNIKQISPFKKPG